MIAIGKIEIFEARGKTPVIFYNNNVNVTQEEIKTLPSGAYLCNRLIIICSTSKILVITPVKFHNNLVKITQEEIKTLPSGANRLIAVSTTTRTWSKYVMLICDLTDKNRKNKHNCKKMKTCKK